MGGTPGRLVQHPQNGRHAAKYTTDIRGYKNLEGKDIQIIGTQIKKIVNKQDMFIKQNAPW